MTDRYVDTARMAPIDAVSAVAGKVAREWGDCGYRMSLEGQYGTPTHPYLFGVRHSDGSEFFLVSDRYGNVVEAAI